MKTYQKTDYTRVFLHFALFIALVFLRFTLPNGEPFGLALVYASISAGFSPIFCPLFYFVTSVVGGDRNEILIYCGQALLMAGGFFLRMMLLRKKSRARDLPPLIALTLSLVLFVVLSPFSLYPLGVAFLDDTLTQKILISGGIFLLSAIFHIAMRALTKKVLKCRLKESELLFCIFLFVTVGVGICRLLGLNAYTGIAFFILLLFACTVKDASTLVCAFVVALPPFLLYGYPFARFFIYGLCITFFIRYGRLAGACAFLCAFFCYGLFDGLYAYQAEALVPAVLSAVLPALAFTLLPVPLIRNLENRLIFYREKHLSRIAINRNRTAIGKQLFEISAVFREIESTFLSLGTTEAEEGAKDFLLGGVMEETCRKCTQYKECLKRGVPEQIKKLIEVGCMKGKVSLIDIPALISELCINQSGVLYAVNLRLGDYKKYMLEAENAQEGRIMLSRQAQGVSEILRDLALEQSQPLRIYTDKEHALNIALLKVGIVCSEVLVYGEEDSPTVSLISYGKTDVKKIANVATNLFGKEMTIAKRLTLGNDKYCCILRKKPKYDAAFGVASIKKAGERASGDTHSVIKIDEHRFMTILCDGMGSGEYAKRVSETTISLLESFYRAKMPAETVLSTINKLLTFSKEETFACVDIAVVELENGHTDIVKIGSPVGFILSGSTVKVLENGSLPLGILDALRPSASSYVLEENDVLLFLSDGITGAFGSTTDLYEVLKILPIRNPQQLVDSLLEKALQAYGGVAKDDMTAVAVRIFKRV